MISSTPLRRSSRPLRGRLKDQLAGAIGREIVAGRLAPGETLPPEHVILERYGVSRTVLREALNMLSAKGLVDARPKRGTLVNPPSDWNHLDPDILAWRRTDADGEPADEVDAQLERLMEVRRIIEPGAAALAARRGTKEDFVHMTAACDAMARAGDDVDKFREADLAFHMACLQASHNEFLLPIAHAIRSVMMISLRTTNPDARENQRLSLPLHQKVLKAVLARDPAAAEAAMQQHLDDTETRRARARHHTPSSTDKAARSRRRPSSTKAAS
jgi:GntR family transcriptional regulator, galactonate operon transcriptional repressor